MPELTQAEKFAQAAALQNPKPPGPGWKYYVKRAAIYSAAAYLLLCGFFFFFQNRIVYRPVVNAELSVKKSVFGPMQGKDIETQTADGVTLNGWHLTPNAKSRKLANAQLVLIYFGGPDGNRSMRDGKYARLLSMGAAIVCFDYRGFGDNAGSANEEGLAFDARAAWNFVRNEGVAPGSIAFYGESLGAAVAVRLAAELSAEKTPPAGVILDSAFSKMTDLESHLYPYIPVSLLLTQHFRSIDRISSADAPLMMIHGKLDSAIPIASARALFDAAPAAERRRSNRQSVHRIARVRSRQHRHSERHRVRRRRVEFLKDALPVAHGTHPASPE